MPAVRDPDASSRKRECDPAQGSSIVETLSRSASQTARVGIKIYALSETNDTPPEDFEYDVAFSLAGEDRGYVEPVAGRLRELGVGVFYYEFEQ